MGGSTGIWREKAYYTNYFRPSFSGEVLAIQSWEGVILKNPVELP